ncbi:hypothetical protein RRG08_046672 [Elysia crispata]|uniref:Uncharacterized protein n=1 Tax=Elysia crispata TaxID=231223 RepID=A0AAE1D629_9GAST|nr:hypothetical protein RRG08_046672 [Elysia crispata]
MWRKKSLSCYNKLHIRFLQIALLNAHIVSSKAETTAFSWNFMRDVISDPIFPGAAVAEKGMGWGCDHRSTVYEFDLTFSKQGQATKSVECVVPRTLERISDIPTQTKPLLSSLLQKV